MSQPLLENGGAGLCRDADESSRVLLRLRAAKTFRSEAALLTFRERDGIVLPKVSDKRRRMDCASEKTRLAVDK